MSNYDSHIETVTDTISGGSQISGGARVKGKVAIGVVIPASTEGTNLDLEVSFDGGSSWHSVFAGDGTQKQVQAADGGYNPLDSDYGPALEHVRLNADTNQTGDTTLTWVFKP